MFGKRIFEKFSKKSLLIVLNALLLSFLFYILYINLRPAPGDIAGGEKPAGAEGSASGEGERETSSDRVLEAIGKMNAERAQLTPEELRELTVKQHEALANVMREIRQENATASSSPEEERAKTEEAVKRHEVLSETMQALREQPADTEETVRQHEALLEAMRAARGE